MNKNYRGQPNLLLVLAVSAFRRVWNRVAVFRCCCCSVSRGSSKNRNRVDKFIQIVCM